MISWLGFEKTRKGGGNGEGRQLLGLGKDYFWWGGANEL